MLFKYRVADEYSADRLNRLTSEANDSKIGDQESSQDKSGPGGHAFLVNLVLQKAFYGFSFLSILAA